MDEATATACAETKRQNVILTNLLCYKIKDSLKSECLGDKLIWFRNAVFLK